ncbi:MAG: hypothetical protein J6Q67_08895 [Clostridia bacterium]|nr:hypothetical protein [Clostridia bacterium]
MKLKSLAALLSAGILAAGSFISASADTIPMTMKELDKSYLTLVFDDNITDSLKTFYEIITLEYGYPICAAVPSGSLKGDNALLHDIENHGGEILSHTKSHKVFNRSVPWDVVEAEMKDSLKELTAAGFDVKGINLAGGGGTEDTDLEYRTEIEKITSKYYLYSDLYGASEQYYKPRDYLRFTFNNNPEIAFRSVRELAKTPQWKVWFAHNTSELNEKTLRSMLDEIKKQEKEGKLEVVTYRTMYTKNAVWQGNVDLGKTKYTVDFYSTDNKTLLYSAVVNEGGSATAPQIETSKGVTFKKWSGSFSNVTKNMSVYAICDNVKTSDPSAVGLKHDHLFFASGKTQTCELCGLVTPVTKPNSPSTVTSAPTSSTSSTSSQSTSSSDLSVSSDEVLTSDNTTSTTDGTSSDSLSANNPTTQNSSGKKVGLILTATLAAVSILGAATFLIIKKRKK